MQEMQRMEMRPDAREENIVVGKNYRITLLTAGLIRLEYADDGVFEDDATKMAFFRDFPATDFRLIRTEDGIEIQTPRVHLTYNEKEFSGNGLSIQVKGNLSPYHSKWSYGMTFYDLKGTARTLDEADGAIPLEPGILSSYGFSLIDDSLSQTIPEDGWPRPRKGGVQDLYFFGYGHDYKEALKDFYYLCGKTPMLPRYALGNWWSRYYKYTEESYLELMDKFMVEDLPFTVAVIDMDWHLVNIDPKYGSGWTGYTWNKEFFPDPPRFLKALHDRGMKITLNVHPADGVKGHEEAYLAMAKEMGVDYEREDPVVCDLADPHFLDAYFKYLHHPLEEEGVDFWWIDWQQGAATKIPGLDPLWILNHFHFLDNGRSGLRPMTFSRYAGPGSHRYPVGFSGDTFITWESLQFQPYFTSTASNIGYGWWSHDIGGHMHGYKNDEMEVRWYQFGIYSPIMRLHSSNSEFNGKEPWRFKKEAELAMGEALRERHRMMPYLYTINHRSYSKDLPMVLPMYYEYPDMVEAYEVPNQYYFGDQLIVMPITEARAANVNVAKVSGWLPEGYFYDIHTDMVYAGGRSMDFYRSINEIPVFLKAGGILPLSDEIKGTEVVKNPETLRILVFPEVDGSFQLYEDDCTSQNYQKADCVSTPMEIATSEEVTGFFIQPAKGNLSLIPGKRTYVLEFVGMTKPEKIYVTLDGANISWKESRNDRTNKLTLEIADVPVKGNLEIRLEGKLQVASNAIVENSFDFLNQAEISFDTEKERLFQKIQREKDIPKLLADLSHMELSTALFGALVELLTAN